MKPCVASAKRILASPLDPSEPTLCHVAPPSVVSATAPFFSSAQPWFGEIHVAESAGCDGPEGAVVVVATPVVGTTTG